MARRKIINVHEDGNGFSVNILDEETREQITYLGPFTDQSKLRVAYEQLMQQHPEARHSGYSLTEAANALRRYQRR